MTIRIAGLDDIINSKEWANRPKDHDALPELYALRDARSAAEVAGHSYPRAQHLQAPRHSGDTPPCGPPQPRSTDRDIGR